MTAQNSWRPLSRIPMFELPKPFGNAVYESTYNSDFQKRRSLENFDDDISTNSYDDNGLFNNQSLSQSFHDLSVMKAKAKEDFGLTSNPLAQPLYKTNKYGLLPIHRSKKIDGINYFRSHMDPSVKKKFESQSLYNFDFSFQKPRIPSYIKRDGYVHTNAEKNVRYLSSYNGSLIPYIPSLPLNKKASLPPIRTDETVSALDTGRSIQSDDVARHYSKLSTSSQELGKYFNNLNYHKRDAAPPAP